MSAFLNGLELLSSHMFDFWTKLFNVMMQAPVLTAVIALWVLDRIFGIFDYLKG